MPILELLRSDSSLYVRKSVANLLRDASAAHAALVLETCFRWVQRPDKNAQWIIRHGLQKLRTTHPHEVQAILGAS
jgi:3-methyladenine DNA glycosylase AlkC